MKESTHANSGPIRVFLEGDALTRLEEGGIKRYFREILSRITRRHPDIQIHLWLGKGVSVAPAPNLHLHRELAGRPSRLFQVINRVRHARLFRSCDLYHSSYYNRPPSGAIPWVLSVYDFIDQQYFDSFSENPPGFRLRLLEIVGSATDIIAISDSTRDDVLKYTNQAPDRVSVCRLAVDAAFRQVPAPEAIRRFQATHRTGDSYVLYVGRRWGYKNFGVLLEGWLRYRKAAGPAVKLVCIGAKPDHLVPHHFDALVQSGFAKDFVLIVRATEEELLCAYRGAELLVYPSLVEGFGLPILEAAASGCPLLLSDIAAFREVAGGAAEYFNPTDPNDLAQKMGLCLEKGMNDVLRNRAGTLPDRFSWEEAADIHAGINRRAVGRSRGSMVQ